MNKTQTIVAELIKQSSFNNFDGDVCVDVLTENEELWDGFVWGRFDGYNELITLRDIKSNQYNADTLYILAKQGRGAELKSIITEQLRPDEISFVESTVASVLLGASGTYNKVLLRCWWD
jgi:hypothetical protein